MPITDKIQVQLLLVALLISLYFLMKWLWSRRNLYYYSAKVRGPTTLPIVGNAFSFLGGNEAFLETAMAMYVQYKGTYRIWLGPRLFFCISKPKDLELVMNNCLDKAAMYEFTRPVVGLGLFSAPVEQWKKNRKHILPTFNQKILNNFMGIFVARFGELADKLEQHVGKGIFNVFPMINRNAVEIICESALGQRVSFDSTDNTFVQDVARAMEIVYIRMHEVWYHLDFLWDLSEYSKEMTAIGKRTNAFLKSMIEAKKQAYRMHKKIGDEYSEEDKKRKAFLDYLVELSEDGANWSDQQIADEAITIAIGGSDSTSSMNSFALVMLGMHQEIQDRVYNELWSIFGDDPARPVTLEDLPKMVYLERVMKETMRIFPVGPMIVRGINKDIKLDTCTLPKGSECVLGIINTHRDPETWPDPLKFNPDRFLPEEIAKRHPYSFVPFSGGPRNCIGPRYAMMSMKTAMATMLRRFKVTTDYKSVAEIKVKADLMIKSVHGCRIALEYR